VAESWRPVGGWPYEASSLGRIRSVDRVLSDGRRAGGVVLKPTLDDNGYPRVTLSIDGKPVTKLVHQLVGIAWHGARPRGKEVRHKNGVKTDVSPSNLAWGTKRQQEKDKKRHRHAALSPAEPVRLSDAVALGVVSISLAAIRKASRRPGFPQAVSRQGLSRLYDQEVLRAWEQGR